MSKVVFGNEEGAAPAPAIDVASVVTQQSAPVAADGTATTTSQVPAVQQGSFRVGDELPGFKDVILPRLNFVHDIGELKDQFIPGSIVFNKATVLFVPPDIDVQTGNVKRKATPPVIIYVLGIVSKKFAEILEKGFGGSIADTEAEVRAQGGTLDYKEWDLKKKDGMRRFGPLVDILIAVQQPEGNTDTAVFSFPVGKLNYALAIWSLQKTAYTEAMKSVFNYHRVAGCLQGGYFTHSFALSTRIKKYRNGNQSWVPLVVPVAKASEEFIAFVHKIVSI